MYSILKPQDGRVKCGDISDYITKEDTKLLHIQHQSKANKVHSVHVIIFWVVTPCSGGRWFPAFYRHIMTQHSLLLQTWMRAGSLETLVTIHQIKWSHNPEENNLNLLVYKKNLYIYKKVGSIHLENVCTLVEHIFPLFLCI